jgi:hypothetical protein
MQWVLDNPAFPAIVKLNGSWGWTLTSFARGVNAERLGTEGLGLSPPVADNSTPEGRAQNRRVVFREASVIRGCAA